MIRRLVVFAVIVLAPLGMRVAQGTAGAGRGPVPVHAAEGQVPSHLADPLGGSSAPVVVAYRDVIAAANAHLLRAAVIDPDSRWIAVVDGTGEVFAAQAPAPNGGAAKPTIVAAARMPSAFAVSQYLQQHGVFVVRVAGRPGGGPSFGLLVLLALPAVFVAVVLVARRRGGPPPQTEVRTGRTTGDDHAVGSAIRFADVAGCDEAVEELAEIVEFLREPSRFAAVGARMPRGVILHGPPGTGKTLLAKALAGEATVPFFAVSAAELVEIYVGTGPARVRDLFARARREPSGAVIFFDEIDAIGRARSGGPGGSREHEATLNQLLVELDGFGSSDRVVVLTATNRLDILDQALVRPGRFDRHVRVDLPAERGRLAILRLHARDKPIADPEALVALARVSGGMSGASLENILNEAAMMAARARRDVIEAADLMEGQLRAIAGPQRRDAPLRPEERVAIAWHEAGHALAAELCPTHEKTQRVTILARGQAGGLALYGHGDRALHTPQMLHERMIVALAGRVAEELCTGTLSSGAANDLEIATGLARDAVTRLGFSERARGTIPTAGWVSSETRRQRIDEEVDRLIADARQAAMQLLREHGGLLEALATALLDEEQLDRPALEVILGIEASQAPGPIAAPARMRPAYPAEKLEEHPRRRPAFAAAAAALRAWQEVRGSGGRTLHRRRPAGEPALRDVRAQQVVGDRTLPRIR
ncbi:MAG: cell division protease FtsH [Actinomycetota bacterium]|nr:cell division protease FtsH [Actinomycetota bacterium]